MGDWGTAERVRESLRNSPRESPESDIERGERPLNERIAETLKEVLLFITSEYIFV